MKLLFLLLISQLRIGPYMNWDDSTTTTIRINWRTYQAESSIVAYGIGSLSDTIVDTTQTTIHSIKLTGLTPNSVYSYKIIGNSFTTPVYHFHTAPTGADSINFVIYGDTRSNGSPHRTVVHAIAQENPQFVINTGDLVPDGRSMSDWYAFFDIEAEMLRNAPIMPCIGNHDTPPTNYLDLFYLPGNEEYYSFKYGNLYFIALNTESNLYAQRPFLTQELINATQDSSNWVIVYFHRPPYSAGGHGSSYSVRNAWCSILSQYHVPVVFNGHNHFYQRTIPINGVTYIVTGGGGAPLYSPGSASWVAYSEACYHYMRITATANRLSIKAVRATDGVVIDSVTFTKPVGVSERIDYGMLNGSIRGNFKVLDITGRVVGNGLKRIEKPGIYFLYQKGKRLKKICVVK